MAGINPRKLLDLGELPEYLSDWRAFAAIAKERGDFRWGRLWPVLGERSGDAGIASGHYFHQDLHVAQKIYAAQPEIHVDVGSRVDGFVAHVATFREIEVLDIRPLSPVGNIKFSQRDIMKPEPSRRNYTDSLSCLHVAEHFGLGRYGDALDYDGHLRAFRHLADMVRPGGTFYFSVPISSDQRIEFNAHRVFSLPYVTDMVSKDFDTVGFAYVDDAGDLHSDIDINAPEARRTFGLRYGCGIFELVRRS